MTLALAYNKQYAFNGICPYYTMFPLEYPLRIIQKYRKISPSILDPFCGRGTTIYAARRLGLSAYGLDTSPIAAAIAQAKLASASLEDVIAFAEVLLQKEPKEVPDSAFFRNAFSAMTLKQLCSLREGLIRTQGKDEAAILRGAALGCLHGPIPKSGGTASYFSNQMPRTFASKPDYSMRFWKQHGLIPSNVSVLDVLRKKLARITDLDSSVSARLTNVGCKDARAATSYRNVRNITITITSPPYYGMRTYIQDQWLRNWFLGGPYKIEYKNDEQLRHTGHEIFITDLAKVWKNVRKVSNEDAHLYVRFGSIRSAKSDPRQILKASLEQAGGWSLVSMRHAKTAEAGKRQAEQMGRESNASEEFDFHAVRV
jgi:DNA methylase